MSKTKLLADRLHEVFIDGKWIANTNWKEQIEAVTWSESIETVKDLNSIALLTFHLNYYLAGLIPVFDGGALEIRDKFSFDMPLLQSEKDWENIVKDFISNAKVYIEKVRALKDNQLAEPFVDPKYGSYQRIIEAMIEHAYYHLGQVVIIRKLVV